MVLNEQQYEAVTNSFDKHTATIAAAGSGKTRVLVERIAHIVDDLEVEQEKIIALTFTQKAAYEMRERVEAKIGYIDKMSIGTFHHVCSKLLRVFGEAIGVSKDFKIYDEYKSKGILIDILKSRQMDYSKYAVNQIASVISMCKSNNVTVKDLMRKAKTDDEKLEVIIYSTYEKECDKRNALDYDSVITKTIELLQDDFVKSWVESNIDYILVDEYQDINYAQYILIKSLLHENSNLFVVGDEKQCIYQFRCSSPKFLEEFETMYDNTKLIYLDKNYRSTQNIVNASNSLIKHNNSKLYSDCITDNEVGAPVYICQNKNGNEESIFVSQQIQRLVADGYKYSDIAVLYRINSQSASIEESLINYNIPYHVEKGMSFFKRAEIKDILSFAKFLISEYRDKESFVRSMGCIDGIGKTTIDNIVYYSDQNDFNYYTGLYSYLEMKKTSNGNKVIINKVEKILSVYDRIISYEFGTIGDFFKNVIRVSEYENTLLKNIEKKSLQDKDTINARVRNIKELPNVANQMCLNSNINSIEDFILKTEVVENEEDMINRVKLITMHSAKGLEYKAVFVIGLEEGNTPHSLNSYSEDSIKEERRLFYVAMTRAKKELYITYCKERVTDDSTVKMKKSRFLEEISPEFTKII